MIAFILRRVFQSVLVLLIVGLVAFAMFSFVGDPVENMLGQERTQADVDRLREQMGLDQPIVVQYWTFLGNAFQGNFGLSYRQGREVSQIIAERLPATLELAFVSGVFAMLFGIGFGVFTAIRRNGIGSNVIMTLSLVGVSLPTFLIGILLIWRVFRRAGHAAQFRTRRYRGPWVVEHGVPDGKRAQGADPAVDHAWSIPDDVDHAAGAIRDARGAAAGLHPLCPGAGIARKVGQLPPCAQEHAGAGDHGHGSATGSIIAFAIITETVFQWPGVGLLFINAIQFVDIPVMAAYLMLISVMFVGINLIVDLLYFAIDPRLRVDGTKGH